MRRTRKSVTIQDVAQAAGVSVSTISRVLNNKDDVSLETYERVQAVVEQMGYASSLAARGMRSHRTQVIGLIMPDVASPYCIEVMQGVNQAIAQSDYDLIIYTNGDIRKYLAGRHERRYVTLLNGGITDGVIVVAGAATNFVTNAPVVIIDPNHENPDYPAITSTNYEGVMAAMAYLTGLGHRRIGFITGRLGLLSARQRYQGYLDGLAAAGIEPDDELVQEGDYTLELAVEKARTLLSLRHPPTAIAASNDMSAMGVYQAAAELGVRIPEDLSVVGFDNLRESVMLNPQLTTVDQFLVQTGFLAVQMIRKLIDGQPLEEMQQRIKTQLLIRKSCLPPK